VPRTEPLLELAGVEKHFGLADEPPVLRGVELALVAGEALAVEGPSGSGKTTLLNLMGGLDVPTAGTVRLAGADLAALSESERTVERANRIGFVFQRHHLLPQCTVLENVLIPTLASAATTDAAVARQRAAALLERVGLADRQAYLPGALSVGQCQRAALVRALVNAPDLLLADEPTGALDRETAAAVGQLLLELPRDAGTTLVVATHDTALAARLPLRRRLREGRLEETA
jgi:ABC-type lipoprotein export system ATPase subunit